MNGPKVSVIIPVYNDPLFIGKAINSVVKQTYKNIEIIVIDDGSDDEKTKDEIFKYDMFITYHRQENSGVAIARNKGIEKATGEYIAYLDSDDIFKSDKIEKQLNYMICNGYDISYTNYEKIDINGSAMEKIVCGKKEEDNNYPAILAQCLIATATVMLKTDIARQFKFRSNIHIGEDTCYWIDIAYKHKVHLFSETLSQIRVDDNSAAYNIEKQKIEIKNIVEHIKANTLYNKNLPEFRPLLQYLYYLESKKILFLNESWLCGGVEKVISSLANNLCEKYEIHVLTYNLVAQTPFWLNSKVRRVEYGVCSDLEYKILEYIKLNHIDIVVGNSGITDIALNIYEVLIENDIKLIVCNHEYYFYPFHIDGLHNNAYRRMKVLKKANLTTFVTPLSTNAYRGINDNGVLVPNLINIGERKEKLSSINNRILAVGRWYDSNKHLDRILKIFSCIVRKNPLAELCLVGPMSIKEEKESEEMENIYLYIKELGIDKTRVTICGQKNNVEFYYKNNDIFLLTSETEAFGMVLAEAGSFGLPTVMMDIPGVTDYVIVNGENGFICSQNDILDVSEKVLVLMENTMLYNNMSRKAYEMAQRFKIENIIVLWEKIFEYVTISGQRKIEDYFELPATDFEQVKIISSEYWRFLHIKDCNNGQVKIGDKGCISLLKKTIISLKNNGIQITLKKMIDKVFRMLNKCPN